MEVNKFESGVRKDSCFLCYNVVRKPKGGNIGRGTCLYCGAENGMEYEGRICFICSKCGKSAHEDIYYYWAAGGSVELDE